MATEIKKEAIELRNKFRLFLGTYKDFDGDEFNNYAINKNDAKKLAIIHCEEMIKQEKHHVHHKWVEHFEQLKQELEKL